MRRSACVLLILVCATALDGCSSEYQVAPVPPAAESTAQTSSADKATAQPGEFAAEPVAAQAAPPAAMPTTTPPPSSAGPAIRLSAGVALPQSLPTGTAMGFSVDYQFVQGSPETASRYVWVILGNQPEPVRQDVQLRPEGTLQVFVPQWRPEHGPFRCHIEDGHGQRLSASLAFP